MAAQDSGLSPLCVATTVILALFVVRNEFRSTASTRPPTSWCENGPVRMLVLRDGVVVTALIQRW